MDAVPEMKWRKQECQAANEKQYAATDEHRWTKKKRVTTCIMPIHPDRQGSCGYGDQE